MHSGIYIPDVLRCGALCFFDFTIILLKLNALDVIGLLISAFGLLASLIANIVSVLEVRG
jgi:hypothetical protein